MVNNLPASAGDASLIPRSERSPGEGRDNPLQSSCLSNPMNYSGLVGYSSCGHKRVGYNLATKQQTTLRALLRAVLSSGWPPALVELG